MTALQAAKQKQSKTKQNKKKTSLIIHKLLLCMVLPGVVQKQLTTCTVVMYMNSSYGDQNCFLNHAVKVHFCYKAGHLNMKEGGCWLAFGAIPSGQQTNCKSSQLRISFTLLAGLLVLGLHSFVLNLESPFYQMVLCLN